MPIIFGTLKGVAPIKMGTLNSMAPFQTGIVNGVAFIQQGSGVVGSYRINSSKNEQGRGHYTYSRYGKSFTIIFIPYVTAL